MNKSMLLCLLLVTSTAFASSASAADSAGKEIKKFTGTWQCVSATHRGRTAPNEVSAKLKLVFDGNKMTVDSSFKKTTFEISVDPTKNPRVIKMIAVDGEKKGKGGLGIYAWEKDQLKMCLPDRPNQATSPPNSFDTSKVEGYVLLVLKKVDKQQSGSTKKSP